MWCQHATVISLYLYSVNKMYEIKTKRKVDILMILLTLHLSIILVPDQLNEQILVLQ